MSDVGHPELVTIEWELAVALLRLLDGLGYGPEERGLISYSEDGPFEFSGERVPEARALGERLSAAVHPGFDAGDRVVARSTGKHGVVKHMVLFDSGWYVAVEFADDESFHPGTDLIPEDSVE